MLKIRSFNLDPGTGRPHDPVTDRCPLFYLASGEYVLFTANSELLWRSDNVPKEAYIPYSRLEKLRESAEDIIRFDLGNDTLDPTLYEPAKEFASDLPVMDPIQTLKLYPDLLWLTQVIKQKDKD